jgi:plasmid stabilization system protein ParE
MKYLLLAAAYHDLDAIDAWITSNFGTNASLKAQRRLFETFELLADHPGMGIARPELTTRPVRFFVSTQNWIIYQPGSPTLIHRIFPAARDIETLQF